MGDVRPLFAPLNGDRAAYILLMTDYLEAVGRGLPKSMDRCEKLSAYYEAKHSTWAGQWTMSQSVEYGAGRLLGIVCNSAGRFPACGY